ncbi:MAG: FtsQ-type POTRA domain-containing protein [Clostridia bacterium]|nr:FtsQ-type POTRA domain-containing protein [Clostridia bacterium]
MEDEIIIGVENKSKQTSNKKNKKSKKNKKVNHKKGKMRKQAKVVFGIVIFIVIFILVLCSPIFDIKNIETEGNSQISNEKLISISSLQLHTNIFKFNKGIIKEKIKENAYIDTVEVTRKLPSTVQITVTERVPKYMLQFADSYVYINNQGYMLEISNEKLEIPILIGFTTDLSNIKAGNRINVEDLKKMDMVIKIYEAAKSNGLGELITKIDISNEKNYSIILEKEGKKVYLGECTELNTRILYLKSILETLNGKSGELFLNIDLNSQEAYFRPSSN